MKVDKNTVEKILSLEYIRSRAVKVELPDYREVLNALENLKPLNPTKIVTNLSRHGSSQFKIVVFDTIREQYEDNRRRKSKEIKIDEFLNGIVIKKDLVDGIAKNISNIQKQKDFIKLCEILSKLKIRDDINNISITRVLDKSIQGYNYEGATWREEKYNPKNDVYFEIKKITFNGDFDFYDVNNKQMDVSISISDMFFINVVDDVYEIMLEMIKEWLKEIKKAAKEDELIILDALKSTAKYDIIKRL